MRKLFFTVYQQILRIYVSTLNIKKTEIIHEIGSAKKIGALVKQKGFSRVLIITDQVLTKLGLLDGMIENLKKENITYAIYDSVVPNPTIKNIEEAKALYTKNACQAIIAFGGGSVIDCAKMAGVVALTGKPVKRYDLMIPMIPKMAPLIAVPTTAGTGSEVTISAVITDETRHKKMGITDAKLAPDIAILDAELMVGLPKPITAATGIDALTHAVEAYVGNWKFKVTDAYAIKAVAQIFKFLERAYKDGSDMEARHQMAIGATYGGYAFRTAGVGYVHGIAHRLSELYGVPHGLANAIVLPHVLRKSFKDIYKKLADLSKKAELADARQSDREIAEEFIVKIEDLNKKLGIPKYADKIKSEDIPLIAKRAIGEANKTYPVPGVMNKKEMAAFVTTLLPPK
ncbi:MAG: iron-containing alcohol dehydrogenase [Eubacteriales bacterium]